MKRFFPAALLAATLAGCAYKARETRKPSSLDSEHALVVGRVHLKYNGQPMNGRCSICINATDNCARLDDSGLVFLRVEAGQVNFNGFTCKPGTFDSFYHYQISGVSLKAPPQTINYFGDLNVDWKAGRGGKASNALGVVGVALDQLSNDGKLSYTVSDRQREVIALYAAQAGVATANLKYRVALISGKPNP